MRGRDIEENRQRRHGYFGIQAPNNIPLDAACKEKGLGGIVVAVAKHDPAGRERGLDDSPQVVLAVECRKQHERFHAAFGNIGAEEISYLRMPAVEVGWLPCYEHREAPIRQPFLRELQLRGLAATVNTAEGHERAFSLSARHSLPPNWCICSFEMQFGLLVHSRTIWRWPAFLNWIVSMTSGP